MVIAVITVAGGRGPDDMVQVKIVIEPNGNTLEGIADVLEFITSRVVTYATVTYEQEFERE